MNVSLLSELVKICLSVITYRTGFLKQTNAQFLTEEFKLQFHCIVVRINVKISGRLKNKGFWRLATDRLQISYKKHIHENYEQQQHMVSM